MQPTTSQARIDANRHNAQLSTGPRTEAGKQASSKNATKHGFFSRLGPAEEPAFRTMLTGLYRSLRPADEIQQILVDQIGLGYLRLSRLYKHELQSPTPPVCAPTPDGDSARSTQHSALLLRYETTLNRQIERTFSLLWDAKQYRQTNISLADQDPPFFPAFASTEEPAPLPSPLQASPATTKPAAVAPALQQKQPDPQPIAARSPQQAPISSGPTAPASERPAPTPPAPNRPSPPVDGGSSNDRTDSPPQAGSRVESPPQPAGSQGIGGRRAPESLPADTEDRIVWQPGNLYQVDPVTGAWRFRRGGAGPR